MLSEKENETAFRINLKADLCETKMWPDADADADADAVNYRRLR